jgi:hypothetical protein
MSATALHADLRVVAELVERVLGADDQQAAPLDGRVGR